VAALKLLLRLLSILFHTLLTLFLIAVSGVALLSGVRALQFGMLPWTGSTLVYALFFGGLFGLLTVILAVLKRLRLLFFIWTLAVAVLLIKGYFFGGYRFVPGEATKALYLNIASLVSVLGAWFQMWAGSERRY
jgi:hypothetical protein